MDRLKLSKITSVLLISLAPLGLSFCGKLNPQEIEEQEAQLTPTGDGTGANLASISASAQGDFTCDTTTTGGVRC